MRVVRIRIMKKGAFWFFNNIKIGPHQPATEPLDYDILSEEVKNSIDRAQALGVIYVEDTPKERPTFTIEVPAKESLCEMPGSAVATEVESATIEDEEVERVEELVPEEPPVQVEDLNPTQEELDRAAALLKKNGNAVKKILKHLNKNSDSRRFLMACLQSEKENRARPGILDMIEEVFLSIPPGEN